MQQNQEDNGPYYSIGTTGLIYEIDAANVVRDYDCAFPYSAKTWRRFNEEGTLAFFNSDAFLKNRRLSASVARAVVVVRTDAMSNEHDGHMEHVWCVRCKVQFSSDEEPTVGGKFLWPLSGSAATQFYRELSENPKFATSSLLLLKPETLRVPALCTIATTTVVHHMPDALDRIFAASVSPTVCETQGRGSMYRVPHILRNPPCPPPWNQPRRLTRKQRTSPSLQLYETLNDDVTRLIWQLVCGEWIFDPCTVVKRQQRELRTVCRAARDTVDEGCVRWLDRCKPLVASVKNHTDVRFVHNIRERCVWSGVSMFSIIDELQKTSSTTNRASLLVYMRLFYNKPHGAEPPPPPPPPPPTSVVMQLVHNKRWVGDARNLVAHRTRGSKDARVVKMKMAVKTQFCAAL